jgi:hypothetical protein
MQQTNASRFSTDTFVLGLVLGTVTGVALALAALATAQVSGISKHADATTAGPATSQPPSVAPDVRPRTLKVAGVRMDPSHDSGMVGMLGRDQALGMVGMLGRDQALDVVGRDATSTWLAIRFPSGSNSIGWVAMSAVGGLSDPTLLAIV